MQVNKQNVTVLSVKQNVFTHVASIYTIFFRTTKKYGSTPTGLVCNTNMAAVSFCLNTNMAVVTTGENALNSRAFYYETDAKNSPFYSYNWK